MTRIFGLFGPFLQIYLIPNKKNSNEKLRKKPEQHKHDYSEVVTQKVKDVNLTNKTSKEIREIGCISFAKNQLNSRKIREIV